MAISRYGSPHYSWKSVGVFAYVYTTLAGLTLYERNCVKRVAASAVKACLINEFPIDWKELRKCGTGEISKKEEDEKEMFEEVETDKIVVKKCVATTN